MASAIFVFRESLDEIVAPLLLVPSIGFMLVVERFLEANVLFPSPHVSITSDERRDTTDMASSL
jgi:hypothetical protein